MKKLLYIFIIILSLISCKTKYVEVPIEIPIETVKKEYIHDIKIDSVFIHDSIDRWFDGDTFYIYKEHTQYKYLNKIDTIHNVDSIPIIVEKKVPYKVTEIKEVNVLLLWQKILIIIGVLAVTIVLIYILYLITKK